MNDTIDLYADNPLSIVVYLERYSPSLGRNVPLTNTLAGGVTITAFLATSNSSATVAGAGGLPSVALTWIKGGEWSISFTRAQLAYSAINATLAGQPVFLLIDMPGGLRESHAVTYCGVKVAEVVAE